MRVDEEARVQEQCWYCQQQPLCPKRRVLVPMYGNLRLHPPERNPVGIPEGPDVYVSEVRNVFGKIFAHLLDSRSPQLVYDQTTIEIPRCRGCANVHALRRMFVVALALIPVVCLIDFCMSVALTVRFSLLPRLLVVTLCLIVPVGYVGWRFGSYLCSSFLHWDIREKVDYFEYPEIRENSENGWFFGSQPTPEA